MEVLAEHEQWSRSELNRLQLEKTNQIWRHAINYVPYYRQLFRERSLPKEFGSLEEYVSNVPVLDKMAVRGGMLLSEKPRPGRWVYTGGSTGIPLAMYRENDASLEMVCCQYRSRALFGVDVFDRTAMVWGHGVSFAPGFSGRTAKLRRRLEDLLRDRVRLSAYRLGKEDIRRYLRKMTSFKPVLLYGYSSAVYLLSLEALQSGVKVDSLRLVTLTSDQVTHDIRDTVQRGFRTNVVEEYGAAECQVIAYEDEKHLFRVREDLVMVETQPAQDNYHKIIISVLNNPSFPLLRYDIGDLTDRPVDRADAGFALLGPVVGRKNDFLISRSGRRVHPLDASFLEHHKLIKRFRAHQFSDGRVLLSLEVDSQARDLSPSGLGKKLSDLLEGQTVEVRLTESIPPTVPGKHAWVVSELADLQQPSS